jgi:hypothetical protein
MTARAHRDRAWIEREYNREKYPRVLAAVRETLAGGERDLARILGHVCFHERGTMTLSMHKEIVCGGHIIHAPVLFAAGGVSSFVVEALAEACSAETEMVIELGAGWGRNLFLLHLSGRISAKTQLRALEFAETARIAGTLIASAVPAVPFEAAAYDYHAPDYSMIPPSDAPTLVATIHSAEQIPALSADVILKLMERRPHLRGVHIEPVSFQIPVDRRGLRGALTSADYAATHDYNRNLWHLLASLEAEGLIEIADVVPDVIGLNPSNPSTLICWRSKQG